MSVAPATVVFLFTDIEGSTRLWETQPERMREALAAHDVLAREAVTQHQGRIVKSTGDGLHAVFGQARDALAATLALQRGLQDPAATAGLPLAVRCGLHLGADEARDNDFYGQAVNRAARIMAAAHGGQVLLSQAVALTLAGQLPEGVSLRDLGQVRLRDLSEPERVFQLLAPPLRSQFPALRALADTPNNLTQPLNRFIGREQVLVQVQVLLTQHRLVTLFGTGGIGKSRLSQRLAAELLPAFPDGVWFIELSPLTDGQRVAQTVASVLGIKEDAGRPVEEALARFVADRRLLLILDNCEHVLDGAALVAKQLLQAGGQLRLLATSREVLRVAGEVSYPVPALSVPLRGVVPTAEQLLQHEAVRLFTDRARNAQPAFALDERSTEAVAEICQRLDGIPLALELAAARVRSLPVVAIAQRLRENFRLLSTQDATVPPRQRTLQLLIDWSHDLLLPHEQVLYRRLAVFAGGWTLEAAEAVCGGDEALDSLDVLDVLTLLVEKSLVMVQADAAGQVLRYHQLDTVRQHALARLQQAEGAAQPLRQRHAAECLALVDSSRQALAAHDHAGWLQRLDIDRENLLAALAWSAEPCEATPAEQRAAVALGADLAFALRPYWINRGLLSAGLDALLAVLGCPAAQPRDKLRARGLFAAGQLCLMMGRYGPAQHLLAESLAISREVGHAPGVMAVLQPLGAAAVGLGDLAAARDHYEAGVQLAREQDNPRQLAAALNALAQLERTEGRLAAAEQLYLQVLQQAQALGDQDYLAVVLLNLAMVLVASQRLAEAVPTLQRVMDLADATGSRPSALCAIDVAAGLAAQLQDWPRAAQCFGLTERQNGEASIRRDAADEAFLQPLMARARQALGEPAYEAAAALGRATAFEPAWQAQRQWLAALPASTLSSSR